MSALTLRHAFGKNPSSPTSSFEMRLDDGAVIVGNVSLGAPTQPVVVLIHGWTGTRAAFDLALPLITPGATVIRYDLRWHGDSTAPSWGHRVARLAADLEKLLEAIPEKNASRIVLVGCSLGAAIIWAYAELFGTSRIAGAVFVDQAPLQNEALDWKIGSKGLRTEQDFIQLSNDFSENPKAFAKALVESCTGDIALPNSAIKASMRGTLRANPNDMIQLMADHTRNDWRPGIQGGLWASTPILAIAGGSSRIFPSAGVTWSADAVSGGRAVVLPNSGHWPHIDDPSSFARIILEFANSIE